jgi:hypothetical protein
MGTQEGLKQMLFFAKVDKDGNSEEGPLSIEEVRKRISTIGEDLKITSLYQRRSVILLKDPPLKDAQNYYKNCVKSAAIKTRNASILPQQESPV